jgi:ankyrin repeat protein
VLEQLLAAGADPNVAGPDGYTPLLNAISYGDAPTGLLLSHGASPNIYNRKGWSPLLKAVESNDAGKVKLLLEHGADVHHGDRDGWTAYDQALLNGCPEIIAELEKAGATL